MPKAAIPNRQTGTAALVEWPVMTLISAKSEHKDAPLPLLGGVGGKTDIVRSSDVAHVEITPKDASWRLRAGPRRLD